MQNLSESHTHTHMMLNQLHNFCIRTLRRVLELFVTNVWLLFQIVYPRTENTSPTRPHTLLSQPLIRCFLRILILPERWDVFRTASDATAVGREVAQHALTHTRTQFFGIRVTQPGVRPPSVSNDFLFLTHTHTEFQVHICCCSLDGLHCQCVQIILANNFLLPVSDLATSCVWELHKFRLREAQV